MASRTPQQRTYRTATKPLVDYSDDDSDDESNATGIEGDHETREEHVSANDHAIPGMAVLSRKFIECDTTGPYALVAPSAPRPFCHLLWGMLRHDVLGTPRFP
jgi:hypothetical protein